VFFLRKKSSFHTCIPDKRAEIVSYAIREYFSCKIILISLKKSNTSYFFDNFTGNCNGNKVTFLITVMNFTVIFIVSLHMIGHDATTQAIYTVKRFIYIIIDVKYIT